jgi:hypothetical protein
MAEIWRVAMMTDHTVCSECGTVTMTVPNDGSALVNPWLMECEWGHVMEPMEHIRTRNIYEYVA